MKRFFFTWLFLLFVTPGLAQNISIPDFAKTDQMIRVTLQEFNQSVKQNNPEAFAKQFTSLTQALPISKWFYQFYNEKITFEPIAKSHLFLLKKPSYDSDADNYIVEGFFIQPAKYNFVTFRIGYSLRRFPGKLNGVKLDAQPYTGFPDESAFQALVLGTLKDFNQGVQTNKFDVTYSHLTSEMKKMVNPESFKQDFSSLIQNGLYKEDLEISQIYFLEPPKIFGTDNMVVKTYYALDHPKAKRAEISLTFKKEDDQWKINYLHAGAE